MAGGGVSVLNLVLRSHNHFPSHLQCSRSQGRYSGFLDLALLPIGRAFERDLLPSPSSWEFYILSSYS